MTEHNWQSAFSIQAYMYHAVTCTDCKAKILKNFLKEFNKRIKGD